MKKLILMSFVSAALMALAEDSYLYWQVQQDSSGVEFDYAQVKADGTTVVGKGADRYLAADETGYSGGPINTYFDLAYVGSTFVVELLNASGDVVGRSGLFEYSDIKSNIFGGTTPSGASPWTVTSLESVPEPTSGLLFLMGLAGLALRRKRA